MAIPRGSFTVGGAGVSAPGGAFKYITGDFYGFGITLPHYFAGTFFIDTGYDDPVTWTTGVQAAEVYGGRVYASSGTHFPGEAAATYLGKWHIAATPVWQAKFWATPHANTNTQRRILIQCDVYLLEPVSEVDGSYQRLDEVNWSLYRL